MAGSKQPNQPNNVQPEPKKLDIQTLRLMLEEFSGKDVEKDATAANRFLDAIQRAVERNLLKDAERMDVVRMFLVGSARQWLNSRADKLTTWGSFKEAFLNKYRPAQPKFEVLSEMLAAKRESKETIVDFAERLANMALTSEDKIDEEDVKKAFIKALMEENECYDVLHDKLDKLDLDGLAKEASMREKRVKARDGKKRPSMDNQPSTESRLMLKRPNTSTGVAVCSICTRRGHSAEQCWFKDDSKRAKDAGGAGRAGGQCWVCGEAGHHAKQCPKRAGTMAVTTTGEETMAETMAGGEQQAACHASNRLGRRGGAA